MRKDGGKEYEKVSLRMILETKKIVLFQSKVPDFYEIERNLKKL